MREFLSLLIMPIPILFLLLLAAFVFLWRNKKRASKILFLVTGCWLLVITTRPIPVLLVKNLENQYPQLSDSVIKELSDSINIIVLGGGHSDDKNLTPNNQLSTVALGRLVEAIRIYNEAECRGQKAKSVRLVVSGYSGRSKLAQADVLYKTAIILGLDSSNIVISPLPSNTRTEAEEYVKNFGNNNSLILVTSAVHMPRAMMLFKKTGMIPVPAPTNYILKYGSQKNPWRWVPSTGNISMMEQAVHEYAGIAWAKAGGK